MSARVAWVRCAELPEPDPDEAPALEALRAAGLDAEALAWDDPDADPGSFDLCILRATWNYYADPERFLEWVEHAAHVSELCNPPAVVRGNLHKGYLAELEDAGVACVPTAHFRRGEEASLAPLLGERGWNDVVVKPAVSASSYRTRRFAAGEGREAQRFLDALLEERDAMVQPFVESVLDPGEKSLVWIGGDWSHAVIKRARFHGEDEAISDSVPFTAEERELGENALGTVDGPLLYARVDLVSWRGRPVLSELELIEPSLFLVHDAGAMQRFVRAVEGRCRATATD